VAEDIGEQLAKRSSFRRTMKRVEQTWRPGQGIKVQLAGRPGGAEMARCEKQGRIDSAQHLRAKIDYGLWKAKTPRAIGVQVGKQGTFGRPMALMPKR
jgi:small subunit ribosomal protein S3